jgi:hypothetical protein
MSWNLEGKRVSAMYVSKYLIAGTVVRSCVNSDGEVSHSVKLEKSIISLNLGFKLDAGDAVNVRQHQIQKILSI